MSVVRALANTVGLRITGYSRRMTRACSSANAHQMSVTSIPSKSSARLVEMRACAHPSASASVGKMFSQPSNVRLQFDDSDTSASGRTWRINSLLPAPPHLGSPHRLLALGQVTKSAFLVASPSREASAPWPICQSTQKKFSTSL